MSRTQKLTYLDGFSVIAKFITHTKSLRERGLGRLAQAETSDLLGLILGSHLSAPEYKQGAWDAYLVAVGGHTINWVRA